ncbi:MAG: hypothetical protein JWM10_74 [Myxococcaceae bacterium]|nr:hypothetical protein [Myxococcaceae bacterium]
MRSTIYSVCPGCHEKTLVQEMGGTWRCAACSFDYGTLARDEPAREAWMLANLRGGPMTQLAVLHLHRVIRALPLVESNDAVVAFAARHGVALPTGKPTSPLWFVAAVVGGLVVLLGGVWAAFVR